MAYKILFASLVIFGGFFLGMEYSHAATIVVNTDGAGFSSGDGLCTIEEALSNSNSNSDTTGGDCVAGEAGPILDTIEIYTAPLALGDITITPTGALNVSDLTLLDGLTQIDGLGFPGRCGPDGVSRAIRVALDFSANGGGPGIGFENGSAGSAVRGFNMYGSPFQAIDLDTGADGVSITCNHIGTNRAGVGVAPTINSTQAIYIDGANNTQIGGATFAEANVLSGNGCEGVSSPGGNGTTVQGNFIGVGLDGLTAIPNQEEGLDLYGDGITDITIGGTTRAHGNIISGNGFDLGVVGCAGAGTHSGIVVGNNAPAATQDRITIQNNTIGLGVDGDTVIPNSDDGLTIRQSANVLVRDNVISGNAGDGINIYDIIDIVEIYGNYIGSDSTGMLPKGNGEDGINANASGSMLRIGSALLADRNIIIDNGDDDQGIGISDNGVGVLDDVVIANNYVGVTADGATEHGNSWVGISVYDNVTNVVIGGATLNHKNVVVGHGDSATIQGAAINIDVAGAVVQNNYVGVDATGLVTLGNDMPGVVLGQGASAARVIDNIITANFLAGIVTVNSSSNIIQGNKIGTDVNGDSLAFTNGQKAGIYLFGQSEENIVGGVTASEANIIQSSEGAGISVSSVDAVLFGGVGFFVPANNAILGNSIYNNVGIGIDHSITNGSAGFLPDEKVGVTVNDIGDVDAGPNELQNSPVIYDIDVVGGGVAHVKFYLDSTVAQDYHVEGFMNNTPDPSGHGEGEVYLDSVVISHGGTGVEAFVIDVLAASGKSVALTATQVDAASVSGYGSTSEFSASSVVESLGPDFGDAPDTGAGTGVGNYNTISSDNGPYHIIGDLYLGQCVDSDDGLGQDSNGLHDDANATIPRHGASCADDEDGVFFPVLATGTTPVFEVIMNDEANGLNDGVVANGIVDIWIDLDANGSFEDAGEHIVQSQPLTEGASQSAGVMISDQSLPAAYIPALPAGGRETFARVRLASSASDYPDAPVRPLGEALIGEVEDYAVLLVDPGTASIGDYVWEDTDGDGTDNGGTESSLDDAVVELFVSGTTTMVNSKVVSSGYDFTGLPAGTYDVKVTPPHGYTQTFGPASPATISVLAGEDYNVADFGFSPPASEIIFTPSGTGSVNEQGATTEQIVVTLASNPIGSVNIVCTVDGQLEVVSPVGVFTLDSSNYTTGVIVTVQAVDDAVDETSLHDGVVTCTVGVTSSVAYVAHMEDTFIINVVDNNNPSGGGSFGGGGGSNPGVGPVPSIDSGEAGVVIPVYRLWNIDVGDHMYTIDIGERDYVQANLRYVYEGIAGYVYANPGEGRVAVRRLWSRQDTDHFYTTDAGETSIDYVFEGILGYVDVSDVSVNPKLYRLYNPEKKDHFYTRFPHERDAVVILLGYVLEGEIGWLAPSSDY